MIGGLDTVVPYPPTPERISNLLRYMLHVWPEARYADETRSISLQSALRKGTPSREFFLYQDPDAMKAWDRHGATRGRATRGNDGSMLHVLLGPAEITLVSGTGERAQKQVERLLWLLKA